MVVVSGLVVAGGVGLGPGKDDEACVEAVETGRVDLVVFEFEEAVGDGEGESLGEAVWDVVEELGVMDEFEGTGRDEVGLTDEVGTEVFFVEDGTTIIVEFAVDGSETASVTLA